MPQADVSVAAALGAGDSATSSLPAQVETVPAAAAAGVPAGPMNDNVEVSAPPATGALLAADASVQVISVNGLQTGSSGVVSLDAGTAAQFSLAMLTLGYEF